MAEKKVRVRIKPLCNIGGIGKAGDTVWMTPAEAEQYADYVEAVLDEDVTPPSPTLPPERGRETEEDHKIMKPRSKRK